jgi:hypothetical protein
LDEPVLHPSFFVKKTAAFYIICAPSETAQFLCAAVPARRNPSDRWRSALTESPKALNGICGLLKGIAFLKHNFGCILI